MENNNYYVVQLGSPKSRLYQAFQIDEPLYRAVEAVFGPDKFDNFIGKTGRESLPMLALALERIGRAIAVDQTPKVNPENFLAFKAIVSRMYKACKQGQGRKWYYL